MSITVSEDILIVDETLTIEGGNASSGTDSGALIVNGGIGVTGNVNIGNELSVNGTSSLQGQVTIGTGGTEYTLPTARGTTGQMFRFSNASGGVEFSNLNVLNAQSAFGVADRLLRSTGVGTDVEVSTVSVNVTGDMSGVASINVTGDATMGGDMVVGSGTTSTTTDSGALVVSGGVGVSENITVGQNATFTGDVNIEGQVTLGVGGTSYTLPTSIGLQGQLMTVSSTGSLVFTTSGASPNTVNTPAVFGASNRMVRTLGTARDIEATSVVISITDDISGINTINVVGGITSGGVLTVTDTTASTGTGDGAIVVSGGVGIGGALNVGGTADIGGVVTISDTTASTTPTEGALIVGSGGSGGVGIQGNLNVGGTLTADNIVFGSSDLVLTSPSPTALDVTGGVGIGGNLNVGGDGTVSGTLSVASTTSITSTEDSVSNTTGSLIVAGGVGIAKQLNVGGIFNVNNTTNSTNSGSGSLVVAGGMGVAKDMNVTGGLNAAGITTLSAGINAISTSSGTLQVQGGVGIQNDLYIGGTLFASQPIINSTKFFMAEHTVPISVSSTTFSPISWDNETRKDSGLYTHAANSSDITVLADGWYKIVTNVSVEILNGDGISRSVSSSQLFVNGVGVTGTVSYGYHRTNVLGYNTSTITTIQNLTANDVISVRFNRTNGTSTLTSVSGGTRILVSRV